MARLTGIFEQFQNLAKIPASDIKRWLKGSEQVKSVENFIANRIIYPQTVSVTKADLEVDFAILRESVRNNPAVFLNTNLKKIVIKSEFIARFPPTSKLVTELVQILPLTNLTSIYLESNVGKILAGSIIPVNKLSNNEKLNRYGAQLPVLVNGSLIKAAWGKILILPFKQRHLRVQIGDLGEILSYGGELGLVLDLRKGDTGGK